MKTIIESILLATILSSGLSAIILAVLGFACLCTGPIYWLPIRATWATLFAATFIVTVGCPDNKNHD